MKIDKTVHPRAMCALLGLVAVLAALWLPVDSEAARTRSLDEVMHMTIKKVKGKRVTARGRAVGTVAGKGSFHLVLSSGSHATATFFGRNSKGTISGTGVAEYSVAGAISYYSGRITSLRGTGRYAHAASRGITFSGTVNRRTYEVKMHLRGRWHV